MSRRSVAIAKAQKDAARKDFEIAFDRIVYADQAVAKATLDFLTTKAITGHTTRATVVDASGKMVYDRTQPLTAFHADFAIPLMGLSDGKCVAAIRQVKVVDHTYRTVYDSGVQTGDAKIWSQTVKIEAAYKYAVFVVDARGEVKVVRYPKK